MHLVISGYFWDVASMKEWPFSQWLVMEQT